MRANSTIVTHAIAVLVCSIFVGLDAFAAASDVDKTFVGNVSQGGMYEVEASKLAVQRAAAPDVKDIAATEVHDHELVNGNLKRIAANAGIPVAGTLNETFQQRLDKLKSTPASGFDTAYVADMQGIHDKDERLFAKEAVEGADSFKTFAHQTDLIVKRHIGALHGLDR
jgi:putative membrane protein